VRIEAQEAGEVTRATTKETAITTGGTPVMIITGKLAVTEAGTTPAI
jgi:hypothetical protein